MKEKRVIRVGVSNNFNCTENEFNQLKYFQEKHKNDTFFINCNVNTKNLFNINNHSLKSVITINPQIKFTQKQLERLYSLNKENVGFVRVKYIPNDPKIEHLICNLRDAGYKVVLTMMRFATKESLQKYSSNEYYEFKDRFFRLRPEFVSYCDKFNVNICDKQGIKCVRCGLCSTLITDGEKIPVFSLNLSSSGVCKFKCPDCFAHRMQNLLTNWGLPKIDYDHIKKNNKQKKVL